MKYRFYTCDVFTPDRFGGNQLAVLPEAGGLSATQMQQVAREFNFSETTFVLPAEQDHTRKVRIFTPAREVPFAGHPNIGTAFVLASTHALGVIDDQLTVTFEEEAGIVPVSISASGAGSYRCELQAPQDLTLGPVVMPELAAAALSLAVEDINLSVHPPRVAGVGLPFLLVELTGLDPLTRAGFNTKVLESFVEKGISPDILCYIRTRGRFDIKARMFAPLDGVPEDPATGSANCALAALLSHYNPVDSGQFSWRISQGAEIGRPSILDARTSKKDGKVTAAFIGGDCVMVSEGTLTVD
ncbi:MAG: PhzF family phenazine biosynthesis protein [Xanthomonadales bacterium]|nr:PhzF family phenazine biosynthesis protein [Gammaproteobacteria bacterium]MBT8053249.1 PhzF family phenazine biosynthesis protein [Gammaproteobacteria bacterium]NND56841.1 PhzF family phenazine biosynthesis protein [Xanthomonadales bacterium]NNK50289.1 PhzF family phenazine biosynthesis protein [Xanthomonadales bacterium]